MSLTALVIHPLLCCFVCRAPTKAVLYVNDGSSPCDEASWRQLPQPASGPGAPHTFESTPAFVYAHQFVGSDQARSLVCRLALLLPVNW
jgi:hypothetical protein